MPGPAASFVYDPRTDPAARGPLTFRFGKYDEDEFTITPNPSLGDTFDLADAPERTPDNILECARACARFVRSMIVPEDRSRFDQALYRIPSTEAHLVVDCAEWIAEQVTHFPPAPALSSLDGQETQVTGSPSNG